MSVAKGRIDWKRIDWNRGVCKERKKISVRLPKGEDRVDGSSGAERLKEKVVVEEENL